MSSELIVRKNSETLLTFYDNSKTYSILSCYAKYDTWTEFDEKILINAKQDCLNNIKYTERRLSTIKRMLDAKLSYEEVFEVSSEITELEEEIKDYEYSIITLDVLKLLLDECDNSDKFQFTLC